MENSIIREVLEKEITFATKQRNFWSKVLSFSVVLLFIYNLTMITKAVTYYYYSLHLRRYVLSEQFMQDLNRYINVSLRKNGKKLEPQLEIKSDEPSISELYFSFIMDFLFNEKNWSDYISEFLFKEHVIFIYASLIFLITISINEIKKADKRIIEVTLQLTTVNKNT